MSKIINNETNYIYGKNPVKEALKIINKGVLFVQNNVTNPSIKELLEEAKTKNIEISFVDKEYFIKYFGDKNHQGIVLKTEEDVNKVLSEEDFIRKIEESTDIKELTVILDGIKDVGNLGAILRSSLLFNVKYVVLPKDNSAPINDVVIKRSSGAVNLLDIVYVTNITRTIEFLKANNYWVYAADKDGEKLSGVKFSDKACIVFGEEGRGIRPLVKRNCDVSITIPTNNKIDSLNLSVSVGIVLYELNKTYCL